MPEGWMPEIERIPTTAHGGVIKPSGVMSHIMQGYQATMVEWAQKGQAPSAHFTIGRNGRLIQHVSIYQQAWHAGRLDGPNCRPTNPLLPANSNPNDYFIGIEHEGFSGDPWTAEMLEADLAVHSWIFETLELKANKNTVTGHYTTAPCSRKHDPGPTWPQNKIIAHLGTANEQVTLLPHEEEFWLLYGVHSLNQHKLDLYRIGDVEYMKIERPVGSKYPGLNA